MKKFFYTLFLITLIVSFTDAQVDSVYTGTVERKEKEKKKKERNDEWKERVTFGGNLQLQFGSYTFIYLSPTIGYIPFEKVNVGVGLIYNYISINYGAYGKYDQSIYGTHTYARYFITDGVFIQGQYDRLFQPGGSFFGKTDRIWVDYGMVGGGFRQSIGKKASLTTTLMYNLTPNLLSIYPSRLVIQFGFMSTF